MAFSLHICSISVNVFFVTLGVVPSFSIASSTTNDTYYLSQREATWSSSNPAIMENGKWKMKVVLSNTNQNIFGFYFGFYSSEIDYFDNSLSVVAFGEGGVRSSTVVWSIFFNNSTTCPTVPPADCSLKLSNTTGLTLQDSDGSMICQIYSNMIDTRNASKGFRAVVGMKLTEEGNLVIFGSKGNTLWQTFDDPQDIWSVGQRLYKGQRLTNAAWSAGLTEAANFSVTTSTFDNRYLICYRLSLHQNSTLKNSYGLQYGEDQNLNKFVVNLGTSQKSHPLEFIEFIKLESDGHMRIYRYGFGFGKRNTTNVVVDIYISECETQRHQYLLTELKDILVDDTLNASFANKYVTTVSGCQQVCLRNCSCGTAIFSYENNVFNGSCYTSSGILLNARNPAKIGESLTFVKVLSITRGLSPPIQGAPAPASTPNVLPPPDVMSPTPISSSPLPPRENAPKALPPTLPSTHRKKLAAIISASTAGGLIFTFIILICLVMSRKNRSENDAEYNLKRVPGNLLRFSHEELEIATENFSETLGRGGFGSVFKGVLADGTMIAVKRLDKMSQGMREFLAEVETIGRIHHFNLVRLVGFCAENSYRLLVYENMVNGSLDNWIFNRDQTRCLDWETRKKIILDVAKCLAYLHEDCRQKIIHLDIKPHNILLDEKFNAKVSDFGLSKLISRDESQVLIPMRGTPGYLAPELRQSIVTVKVDVYSFGIVVLEIVSKRKNVDSSRSESSFHLLKKLQKKAEQDQLIDLVEDLDEDMQNKKEEVVKMIKIASWCLQNDHTKRPLMSTVVKVLEGLMDVEPNISYTFSNAMGSSSVANDHITVEPQASILSAPR